MGWSDLLRRRHPRAKTTAVGVAASLAEAIVESTNVLQDRLGSEGFGWTNRARADTDECLLECTIFEWFLRDISMSYGFGSQTGAIRRALGGRVLIDLQRRSAWRVSMVSRGASGSGSWSTRSAWASARRCSLWAHWPGGASREAMSRARG